MKLAQIYSLYDPDFPEWPYKYYLTDIIETVP